MPSFEGVTTQLLENGSVCCIELNRPKELNSFTPFLYANLKKAFDYAASEKSVVATILTASGPFFSSGHHLTISPKDFDAFKDGNKELNQRLKDEGTTATALVNTMIDFPKLLIAAVNGPAIGISVTLISLCDIVYVSEKATFTTPFMQWGFSPEGCSSYNFPRIMGNSNANEVLLLGKSFDATNAIRLNFASRIFSHESLRSEVLKIATKAARSSPIALQKSKKLIKDHVRQDLKRISILEMELLIERMTSEESIQRVKSFISSKSSKL